MTIRLGKPDTAADSALKDCLDASPPKSFVMVAGAGSGKTTSLIKALSHLSQTNGRVLREQGQKIACITYTDVAAKEIWGDVGNASLFHVSTIHSFLWTVVRPFQDDIRAWVSSRIGEKIAEAQEKIDKPRTQAKTRDKLTMDIARYQAQKINLITVPSFNYGAGSNYSKGVLGHDDILKIGISLIKNKSLLRTLIASRFPVVFVDESQDTMPEIVAALKQVSNTAGENFCLGFFGDPMQKIYLSGAGDIFREENWGFIQKPENFRCSKKVRNVINRIRLEDDGLQQEREQDFLEGSARVFILPIDANRDEQLDKVKRFLAEINHDPLWNSDDESANVKTLVLVHRIAARRLGFEDIYAALNDKSSTPLKSGLVDGSAWVLRPFLAVILPLVLYARSNMQSDIIRLLREHCPLLTKENLVGKNVPELLHQLSKNMDSLVVMLTNGSESTIHDVLSFIYNQQVVYIDERFSRYLNPRDTDESEEQDEERSAISTFLRCNASQLWGYQTYIEKRSLFETQQGVKGAEFQRVLVILDDAESDYNLFSYGKYFGITPLSDKDNENISAKEDSVISRTRRLFYVSCSRAVKDLAVILFAPDVQQASEALIDKGFFEENDIYLLKDETLTST